MNALFIAVYVIVLGVLGLGFKHEHDKVARRPGYDDVALFQVARKSYMRLPKSQWEGKL